MHDGITPGDHYECGGCDRKCEVPADLPKDEQHAGTGLAHVD